MTLWPFRKRAKANSGDKIATGGPIKSSRNDSKQIKGKQPEPRRVDIPEFPLPPNSNFELGTTFLPQKQYHQGGFSSYFLEHSQTNESSASSHLPHKPTLARKLSKKRPQEKSRMKENPYITPPTSDAENSVTEMDRAKIRFGRTPSKRKTKKNAFNWPGQERSTTFPPPARDVASSLSSHSSVRPSQPVLKGFGKFTPRPKVILTGHEMKAPPSEDQRANTQNSNHTSSRRHRIVSEEELAASSTVDGLADDLDAHGLREAMERDRRRRERKKLAEHRRIEKRLERQLAKQKAAEEMEFDADGELPESSRKNPQIHSPISNGAQTPLSWLRDPSVEDFLKAASRIAESHQANEDSPVMPPANEFEGFDFQPEALPTTHDPELSVFDFQQVNRPPVAEKSGRAKIASFLKKATATRLRKGEATGRIRAGESTLISDSEGDDHFMKDQTHQPVHDIPQLPLHHGPSEHYDGGSRPGSQSSWHSSHMLGFSGHPSESSRPIRSAISSRLTQPLVESPTIPGAADMASSSPHTHHSEASFEARQTYAKPSPTHRYDTRAVSPNAPSAISTLASIDSEGSWLSGKMSRQSISRQSGNISRQSGNLSRQSNTHPTTSLRHHYEPEDDETEDDEYYGRIENGRQSSLRQSGYDQEDKYIDRTHHTILNLSDGEDSEDASPPGRVREGLARSPKFHDPAWRMSSRMGFVKYIEEGDDEPPSPTAATFGEYDPTPDDAGHKPLEHPFAQEGENFVSPLEHLAETRPRYTGTIMHDE